MKEFFNDPSAVPFVGIPVFTFILIILIWGGNYLDERQKYSNYQQALKVTMDCRIAAKDNADKVCGSVPNVKDFIRVAN